VLCELTSSQQDEPLAALLERALGDALSAALILDAAISQSERQRQACGACGRIFPRRSAATVQA
jgi:hypothetical protein